MSERFHFSGALSAGPLAIEGPEAHHLAHVSRLDVGDAVTLFNGDGCEYPAHIAGIERRRVMVEVGAGVKVNRELDFTLTVAAPLPKGDRAQFLIEKLTEVGVTTFVPLATRRSVFKAHENKLEKLERYVIEASKQCGRNVLMKIEPVAQWANYCRRGDLPELRYVADPQGSPLPGTPGRGARGEGNSDLTFAVGPEGGFMDEEIAAAREAGWQLVSLGARILRVETAALALAVIAQAHQ